MNRGSLTGAERDTIVVLCEAALNFATSNAGIHTLDLTEWTHEDFERCRSIITKLAEDEPRPTYTPPGGRL